VSEGPRVSIVLPVRDAAGTLPTALRSVARQSEGHFECVVVDDGSLDGSRGIVQRVAERDPRFRLLSRPRLGVVAALNAGLAAARAPLLARMDADDVMARHRLALQCDALDADPALAGVGCHVRLFPRAGLQGGMRRYERWLNGLSSPDSVARDAFVECPVAHPTLMLRRGRLPAAPYRACGWPEDYDLVLRLLAAGERLAVLPRRLHLWRDHPGRLSRTAPAYRAEAFTACKASHLRAGLLAESPEYVLWGYGATGNALRRALLAHDRRPSHIVELHPGRLGQQIHGARVIPPEALPDVPHRPILASVAGPGPRGQIRRALDGMGFREGVDYVCVA